LWAFMHVCGTKRRKKSRTCFMSHVNNQRIKFPTSPAHNS
jgi:hypothetical protein